MENWILRLVNFSLHEAEAFADMLMIHIDRVHEEEGEIIMTKLCINCKWCKKPDWILRLFDFTGEHMAKYSKCYHPNAIEHHKSLFEEDEGYLVTGREAPKKNRYVYCTLFRQDGAYMPELRCGVEGKHFEAK